MRFFVVCPGGLEGALTQELNTIANLPAAKALGQWLIDPAPTSPTGGVGLAAPLAGAMVLNLHSRIASRVLLQLAEASYRQEDDLYRLTRSLAWEDWFTAQQTLRVDVTAHRSPLKSLNFATLRIKDAIVDRLREVSGERPNIDTAFPNVRVQAHLSATQLTVYLDTSGEALFKRGWRDEKGDAPLKENLAAGILSLTGWQAGQTLFDPMCGSGTFLIEAAQIALQVPAGAMRAGLYQRQGKATPKPSRLAYRPLVNAEDGFGFQRLKPFMAQNELKHWENICHAALAQMAEGQQRFPTAQSLVISGSDINEQLVNMCKGNWQRAQLPGMPLVRQVDALVSKPPAIASESIGEPMMLLNPPYGERLAIQGGRRESSESGDYRGVGHDYYEENTETGRQGAKRSSRESLKALQAEAELDPQFALFLQQFGQHLKDDFGGWEVFILTTDMALPGQLRIKESRRTPLFNGPLECRLFRFKMNPQ